MMVRVGLWEDDGAGWEVYMPFLTNSRTTEPSGEVGAGVDSTNPHAPHRPT